MIRSSLWPRSSIWIHNNFSKDTILYNDKLSSQRQKELQPLGTIKFLQWWQCLIKNSPCEVTWKFTNICKYIILQLYTLNGDSLYQVILQSWSNGEKRTKSIPNYIRCFELFNKTFIHSLMEKKNLGEHTKVISVVWAFQETLA